MLTILSLSIYPSTSQKANPNTGKEIAYADPVFTAFLEMLVFSAILSTNTNCESWQILRRFPDVVHASRVSAVVAALHGIALSSEGKPRRQVRMGTLFLAVLLAGFVVCGAVHIYMGYHHPASLDGQRVPLASWGSYQIAGVHSALVSWGRGTLGHFPYSRPTFIFFGLVLGVAMHLLCLASPYWPIHPVGLLMANTYYLGMMWGSVLLGWALKVVILKYGGAKTYRLAGPLFLGLILGEVFSAVIWALVPVILVAMGGYPAGVGHITILPG